MAQEPDALLRALHQAYARPLQSYVVRLTGDHALAEDVVQEAMVRAWKHPEVLAREEGATRAWLYTVVRNLVIDDRRSARHARERTTDAAPDTPQPDATQAVLDSWLVADALEELTPGAPGGGGRRLLRRTVRRGAGPRAPDPGGDREVPDALRAARAAARAPGERSLGMTGRDTDDQRATGVDPFREWDAAYVLGSLDPADRRAFEDHLRTCAACRAAVAELAGMPGLLRMVPADEATALGGAPTAEVVELASVARAVQRDRRRRTALLASAAAALLVLGGVAGVLLGRPTGTPVAAPSSSSQVTALQLEPVGAAAVSADLTLQEKRWGTRIDWECRYPVGRRGPTPAADVRAGARRRRRHEHGRRDLDRRCDRRTGARCVVEHRHGHDPARGDPGAGFGRGPGCRADLTGSRRISRPTRRTACPPPPGSAPRACRRAR